MPDNLATLEAGSPYRSSRAYSCGSINTICSMACSISALSVLSGKPPTTIAEVVYVDLADVVGPVGGTPRGENPT